MLECLLGNIEEIFEIVPATSCPPHIMRTDIAASSTTTIWEYSIVQEAEHVVPSQKLFYYANSVTGHEIVQLYWFC